jgi:hypothetical protein
MGTVESYIEPYLGIGIEADAAGIGIPATSIISIPDWGSFTPVPDWRYPSSGTGLG